MGHSRSVTRSKRDWTARYRGLVIRSTKFMHFHVPMLREEEDHDRGHAEMGGRGVIIGRVRISVICSVKMKFSLMSTSNEQD